MRLGCCAGINSAADLKAAGFDFLEVNVQQVLRGDIADDEWTATAPDVDALPLPLEAANCLLPRDHVVIGPHRDLDRLREYMRRVSRRARSLGISRLAFGSGDARRCPEGVDADTAFQHLTEFTAIAGEECARQDVLVVIEHLNHNETNTLIKLAETRALCDRVASPGIGLLLDTYHYGVEEETEQTVCDLGKRIKHVHVIEPVQRVHPGAHGEFGTHPDAFDFARFFALLQSIGYDERLSIEGKWTQPISEVGARTADYLRAAWESAKKQA